MGEVKKDIITVSGLDKSFGDIHAVNNLSFRVKQGELFAFLGENGAGKSTTISILCGQMERDSGIVEIGGIDPSKYSGEVKRQIGVVFQNSVLDKSLSVYDVLRSRAALYGIYGSEFEKRLAELDELLSINGLLRKTVGKLSGGQRRRIDIARALIHNPSLLILDEPTTGLDPQTRRSVWNAISSLQKNQNMTVFLTTHYMEEAADADYVVIIEHGRIAANGTPHELKCRFASDFVTIYGADESRIQYLGVPYEAVTGGIRLTLKNTAEATKLIVSHPELFSDYEITKGKMDDVFLAVTGTNPAEAMIDENID